MFFSCINQFKKVISIVMIKRWVNMKKSKCRINKRGKITIYSFILLSILLIYICISSSIFELRKIDLNGNDKISKSDIMNMASIKLGKNLFQYNINDIEKNILKNPYVNFVKVSRKIPDKLKIDIKENTEDAIIKINNKYLYIRDDGLLLAEKKDITNKNIPIITGLEVKEKNINENIKINNKQNLIMCSIKCLKDNNMLREIDTINITKNYIYMKTNNGIQVNMKLDDNIKYNIDRLNEVLIDLKSNNVKNGTVDLTSKEQAVYSPKYGR
jgi:cell division protein FtsQ